MLVDSHAHLESSRLRRDLTGVISRALAADVGAIVTVGSDLESSLAAVTLAQEIPAVYAAVGVHPHNAAAVDRRDLLQLARLAGEDKVVAIGEIGLDFYRNLSPPERQREVFIAQLNLARDLHKPVIVHDREAHSEVLAILQTEASEQKGVLHCYSGDAEMAAQAVALGFYISIAGPITFHNARTLQALVPLLPSDRLLVETDCPFLAPHPHRGKRNEPAYVRLIASKIAALRGVPLEQVADATTSNARRLFGLDWAR
jgi:TatD DNase family protein